jgi:hypothetical protein
MRYSYFYYFASCCVSLKALTWLSTQQSMSKIFILVLLAYFLILKK